VRHIRARDVKFNGRNAFLSTQSTG
jgi:hypothetical protein